MSEWIRPTRYFGSRAVLLTIPRDLCADIGILDHLNDPDEIEAAVLSQIAEYRPELVGGVVQGIRFDYMRFQWQVLYEHKSLPRVAEGMEIPYMPLIPDDAGPQIVEGSQS